MSSSALYTPEVLALATDLARFPLDGDLPLGGEVRSRSCGSTLSLGLALDPDGRVSQVGVRAHACAIGQAAAAIFAQGAIGRSAGDIAVAQSELAAWLAGDGDLPDWPGISAIAAARTYPGRHGAIMLAWQAARDALSTRPMAR